MANLVLDGVTYIVGGTDGTASLNTAYNEYIADQTLQNKANYYAAVANFLSAETALIPGLGAICASFAIYVDSVNIQINGLKGVKNVIPLAGNMIALAANTGETLAFLFGGEVVVGAAVIATGTGLILQKEALLSFLSAFAAALGVMNDSAEIWNFFGGSNSPPANLPISEAMLNSVYKSSLASNSSSNAVNVMNFYHSNLNSISTNNNLQTGSIIQAIAAVTLEDYLKQLAVANLNNAAQNFLNIIPGGVFFDLSNLGATSKTIPNLITTTDTLVGNNQIAAGIIQKANNWFVQSGINGMTADGSGTGFIEDDVMIGGGTNNQLIGGNGDNVLVAGTGSDTLIGGQGNNYFQAGFGAEVLVGNSISNDYFEFIPSSIAGTNLITDQYGNGAVWVGPNQLTGVIGNGSNYTWTASSGTTYQFDPGILNGPIGSLTITNGYLGNGEVIVINNFNLTQAETASGGFLGIKFNQPVTESVTAPSASSLTNPQNISYSATGFAQTITFTLDAAVTVTTNLLVNLGGNLANLLAEVGNTIIGSANASETLTFNAGSSTATLTLIDDSPLASAQSIVVTSQMENSSGTASTTSTSNTLTLNYAATAPVTPTSTVINGQATQVYSNGKLSGTLINITSYTLDGNTDIVNTGGGINEVVGSSNGNNNTISGGNGQDIILVGNGNNQIYGGSVVTTAQAISQQSAGAATNLKGDLLAVGNGNNTVVGSNGNDLVLVGSGNNLIINGNGTDTFIGGVGGASAYEDWSVGAQFVDVAFTPLPFAVPVGYEGAYAPINGNNIPLGTGNDTIYGGKGNDHFWLSNGNNFIDAGGGNDYIGASTGNNTIYGSTGDDTIFGGGGNDYINVGTGTDFAIGQGGNVTIYGGSGNDALWSGDDFTTWATSQTNNNGYLVAGTGNTRLYGAGGNDTLIGGSGNDTLNAGAGNEILTAGSGSTQIFGGAGNDTLIGGSANDTIQAGAGTSYIVTGNGNESVIGGAGNETIVGGTGANTIQGGSATNTIYAGDGGTIAAATIVNVGSGTTTVYGGNGIDLIFGGAGNDVLYAGSGGVGPTPTSETQVTAGTGNTTIYGGTGVDNIFAGAGADIIYAGAGGTSGAPTYITVGSGNTTIYSGSGVSYVNAAGSGTATFVINSDTGSMEIVNSGSGDSIQFGDGITIADIAASSVNYTNGLGYTLTLNNGGTVNVNLGSMTQVSFADGSSATLAQLASQVFVVGSTTYSSSNVALPAAAQYLTLLGNGDLTGTGNNVNDVIQSNRGNDTLTAGSLNDTLIGGGASDVYVVSAAAGTVTTINNSSTNDTLSFAAGISRSNLSTIVVAGTGGQVVVTINNAAGGSVVINGTLGQLVDQLRFADGSTASLGQLLASNSSGITATTSSSANNVLSGNILNMTLTGTIAAVATADNLDIQITANQGTDTLISGTASDTLIGGGGISSYDVSSNSGNVTILNSGAQDTLVFGTGITEQNVIATSSVVNGVTVVTINDGYGSIVTIQGNAVPGTSLNNVSFADGKTTTIAQLLTSTYTIGGTLFSNSNTTLSTANTTLDLTGYANVTVTSNAANEVVQSNAGNDTLVAGVGNDTFLGGGGANTYDVGAATSVQTTINQSSPYDVINFAAGVTLADLGFSTSFNSSGVATITITNSVGGSVVINGNLGQIVDQLGFSNGSTTSTASLSQLLAQQTSGVTAESIGTSGTATVLPETILNVALTGTQMSATGNNLNDVLTAGGANDTLIAGSASDTLQGGGGNTTYVVSGESSNVNITYGEASDTLQFGPGILEQNLTASTTTSANGTVVTITNGAETVTVQQGAATVPGGNLSNVSFADGNTATLTQLLSSTYTLGTSTYSSVSATAGAGVAALYLTGSGNVTATGNGSGDLLQANSGNDTLFGSAGAGNDTLIGSWGATTYQIGYGTGTTTIESTNLSDTIALNNNIQVSMTTITGNAGGAEVVTMQLYNVSSLQTQTLIIDGVIGSMVDTIKFGTSGLNSLSSGLAPLTTGPTAMTSNASITLPDYILNMKLTGTGNLTATGNYVSDLITGNSGNDSLQAGTGNDTLVAGSGNDTLTGSSGITTYAINIGAGNTTITAAGASDVLQFGVGINENDLTTSTTTIGSTTETIISVYQGGTITVVGNNLNKVDFTNNGDTPTLADLASASYTYNTSQGITEFSTTSATDSNVGTNLTLTGNTNLTGTITDNFGILTGNTGNDILTGAANGVQVFAGPGNDTLIAATSGVILIGGNPNGLGANGTTFVVNPGLHQIQIQNAGPNDIIEFNSSVDLSSLIAAKVNNYWYFSASNLVSITVVNPPGYLRLPDGTLVSLATFTTGAFTVGTRQYSNVSTTMAAGSTSLTLLGNGNLNVVGNNSADTIIANGANDTLNAGTGNDTLVAGAGNTTMYGNNAAGGLSTSTTFDVAAGNASVSIMNAGPDDVIQLGSTVNLSALVITQTSTGYTFSSTNLNTVTVTGKVFNIGLPDGTILPLASYLTGNFTAGIDQYSSTSAVLTNGISRLTLTGSNSISGTGNGLNDLIIGNSGNDTLNAGTGNDTLVAGSGNDTLTGSTGATTYEFNYLTGDAATRTITINNSGANDSLVFNTGITPEGIVPTVIGSGAAAVVTLSMGQQGTVIINGGQLNSVTFADGTVMSLSDLVSQNYIDGTTEYSSSTVMLPTNLNNLVITAPGVDGSAYSGNNVISSISTNDYLYAGSGNDTLFAGTGDNVLYAGSGDSVLNAGSGNDTLNGEFTYSYNGGPQSVTMNGGSGNVTMNVDGYELNAVLNAGSGNDTLIAGGYNDTMNSGTGSGTTTYVVYSGSTNPDNSLS